MLSSIYQFLLKCPGLFLLSLSGSGDLQTNIIELFFFFFFFCWGNYSPAVFLLSITNWPLFWIYLVKLTPAVANQGSVIPPFLSELPAKIHSTEGLPVFPLHFAEEKLNRKNPESLQALTLMRSQNSLRLHSGAGLTAVWSSWVLPRASRWPSDQWRLCILGCGAVPSPAGVKAWPDKADKTGAASKGETWPRSTNRPKYARGRQNKHDRDSVRSLLQEGWISLGGNPELPPRKLIG